MGKWLVIILLISIIIWWTIWYYKKINIKPVSQQLDLKSWNADINWIISSKSYCDKSLWICENIHTDSWWSSWWWGWWGWK